MTNIQIRNVPEDLHKALQAWAKEENSSISALVLRHLKQRLELRAFERSLREMPTTETPQKAVNSLHAERNKR